MGDQQGASASRWIVLKFGGTSVSTKARWGQIGARIRERRETGSRVLVVVSALSGVTNELTAIADGAPDSRDRVAALVERHESFLAELGLGREVLGERLAALQGLLDDPRAATRPLEWQADVLGQGELLSSTLGAAYLHASGLDMGWMDARQWLDAMPPQPNQSEWSQRTSVNCQWRADADWMQRFRAQPTRLLITQGFISRHADREVTTLGRGGSDTSAVAVAAAMKADECLIYTDVDGVYTTDPRVVPEARRLNTISFEEMLEMASLGSKVLQIRSVEFAGKYRVPLRVLSSFTPWDIDLEEEAKSGTLITYEEDETMEQAIISGIAFNRDEAKVTVMGVPDKPGIAYGILGPVADANIDVDMILQNASSDVTTDFSFTVHRNEYKRALQVLESKVKSAIGARSIVGDDRIAKVSLVGIGMRTHAGIASLMFKTLAEERINIQMISTSEIKVSVVIEEKYLELAVRALHTAFELDAAARQGE